MLVSNEHMPERNRARAEGVIVILLALVLVRAFWLMSGEAGRAFNSSIVESTAKLMLWGFASFPLVLWLARRHGRGVFEVVGLGPGAGRAIGFGLLTTLPMVTALFLIPTKPFKLDLALGSGLIGPFAEELLFRGVLFGLLWRAAGWSVTSSIVVSSLIFGLAHYANAYSEIRFLLRGPGPWEFTPFLQDKVVVSVRPSVVVWWEHVRLMPMVMTVLPFAAGGAVLAWVAWRWNSLWPAVMLHGFMNLWWDLSRGEHAVPTLGFDPMSLAQLLSVALAILVTIKVGTAGASGVSGASGASGARNELTPVT